MVGRYARSNVGAKFTVAHGLICNIFILTISVTRDTWSDVCMLFYAVLAISLNINIM